MIDSLGYDDAERPRRAARTARLPPPQPEVAAEMLRSMNGARTAAAFILNDASENKVASLTTLGSQSIAARKLVDSLQASAPTIKLNREDTVNVLQFLNDVYSNRLEVLDAPPP
ncbi:P12 [Samia ricini nucleopolyhedrovirus]|nr:P12 [Samia ricini nucleopolyhedrovirus]BBD51269.1 P12 [Samia ricini nucleopolyhedrovirus]BBD51421.1 P12 [Samia ricini nucleopolyhedrovirus]